MGLRRLIVVCTMVFPVYPVSAQTADTTVLSLEQAISRALSEGEEIKIAASQVDIAEAQIADVRADILPQITVDMGYNRQIKSVFGNSGFGGGATPTIPPFEPNPSDPLDQRVSALENALPTAGLASLLGQFSDTPFGRLNTWNAGFTVTQMLFEGSKLWSAARAAGEVRDAADAQYREQREETTLQVRKAYYNALLAAQVVDIARLNLEQAERQLDHVRRQHREGNLSDFDLLQAEVQRDNQTPELLNAENDYDLALLELKRLVNIPSQQAIRLSSSFTNIPVQPVQFPSLTELLTRSKSRPSIESAEHQTEARRQAVRIARSDFWPKVSAFSTYNRQAFPNGLLPRGGDWRTDWAVGFNLSLNLFDGLRTRAGVNEARANFALAREQAAQLEESVTLAVEQAYRNLHRAGAQITARQRTVDQAERASRLAEIRYEEGISTQLEVSDARLQLQRARINHVQAIHDYHIALAELERAAQVNLTNTR